MSTAYEGPLVRPFPYDDDHLQNDARTCEASDTRLTQEDSRKVLAQMAKAYEAAPEPCKGSLGLFMRQALADHVNAEHGVTNG